MFVPLSIFRCRVLTSSSRCVGTFPVLSKSTMIPRVYFIRKDIKMPAVFLLVNVAPLISDWKLPDRRVTSATAEISWPLVFEKDRARCGGSLGGLGGLSSLATRGGGGMGGGAKCRNAPRRHVLSMLRPIRRAPCAKAFHQC